jgi:hypothetical protein
MPTVAGLQLEVQVMETLIAADQSTQYAVT